jgi:hypothetical protein
MKIKLLFATFLVGLFALTSCSKDDSRIKKPDTTEKEKEEKPTGAKQITKLDVAKGWLYFSFSKGEVVTPTNPKEDLSWDIAFNGYIVKLNGGTSGAGQAEAVSTNTKEFSQVTQAPEGVYTKDTEEEVVVSYRPMKVEKISVSKLLTGGFGITTGTIHIAPDNTQKWPSVYAPTKNVYVIKLSGNRYVKFQVTDFYGDKGEPNKLSFQYILSKDGKF